SLGRTANADSETDRRAPRSHADDERHTGGLAKVEAPRVGVPLVRRAVAQLDAQGRNRPAVAPRDRNPVSPRLRNRHADPLGACADEETGLPPVGPVST